jgi:hypothetical protein
MIESEERDPDSQEETEGNGSESEGNGGEAAGGHQGVPEMPVEPPTHEEA